MFRQLVLCALISVFHAKELAGYIDMSNSRYPMTEKSQLFYWFFPAQQGDPSSPLLIWLQGGPGSSGTMGLFFENGPYYLPNGTTMIDRSVGNWNQKYNVLYLDQPIGTGYSVAGTAKAYVTNEDEVASDLYYFLQQWYKVYPAYTSSPLYLTGESYGGHYIPAFAAKIITENQAGMQVPLKGVAIGDGLTDPCKQEDTKPRAAYDMGLIDTKTFLKAKEATVKLSIACAAGDFKLAHDYRSAMEDLVSSSGINMYDVRVFGNYDDLHDRLDEFLNLPETKAMLHVGDNSYGTDAQVSEALYDDVMQSQADKFPLLLENIRVLLYQGQFDWKDGATSNEKWLEQISWEGRDEYLAAERLIWNVDAAPAGWVQSYGALTEVIVNGAGHLAPMDQPERLLAMITTFVENQPFV